jgi:hypothetical protein
VTTSRWVFDSLDILASLAGVLATAPNISVARFSSMSILQTDRIVPRLIFNPDDGYQLAEHQPRDVKIWRYLDFPKFLSLLESASLFLCRLDRLEDQLEGSSPLSLSTWREEFHRHGLRFSPELIRTRRHNTVVNCWHLSERESVAMWKLYSINSFGLAIQSTIESLGASLPKYSGEPIHDEQYLPNPRFLALRIGQVRYIDFSSESAPIPEPRELIFYKRASFEHEQELRLVACGYPFRDEPTDHSVFPTGGERVAVDLPQLLKAVFVAPQAPSWCVELVESAIRRMGFDIPIRHSDLDRDAIY